ncbi:MAG: TIGR03936 family radical SAM-associated protein [Candidatus Omnitrophota bacterium]
MEITKYSLKIIIYKTGEMVYFSQLDIFHILERALRRADLPLYYTQGFNSRVKISFRKALKLGVKGEIETTFYFSKEVSFAQLKEKLLPQLPKGLFIKNSKLQINSNNQIPNKEFFVSA